MLLTPKAWGTHSYLPPGLVSMGVGSGNRGMDREMDTETSTVPEFPIVFQSGVAQALLLSWADRTPLGRTRGRQSQHLGRGGGF